MKLITTTLLVLATCFMISDRAFADTDDATWISQCVADNKKENAAPETVKQYCECMNNQMSSNEKQSITQWETEHPKERKECEVKAGWQ